MRAVARWCSPSALLAGALALALCAGSVPGGETVARAWADEAADAQKAVDDAQDALDAAEARMEGVADDYDAIKQETDDLQARIDEIAGQAMEAQQAVIEGRAALGKTAAYEYLNGSSTHSLIGMVLEAQSFGELMQNLTYLDSIMRYHADEVAAQKERSARYEQLIDDLNFQKDEQERKLEELEKKRAEAESVVSEANSKLANAQSDQVARLEALKQKAEELTTSDEAVAPVDENANTVDREDVVGSDAPVQPDPDPNPPAQDPAPSPGSSPDPAPEPEISWSAGVASAYGGSTDPNTPNPGITATGAVCDDNSMGVAIPTSWPNYGSYLGRTVEISYNGQTVLATINDTGNMGGGSRALDLQPGVWKAFGFSSCLDWGVRTVSYRIL